MKILLTGAQGNIGPTICTLLHEAGYDVHATDLVDKHPLPVPLITANLLDIPTVRKLIKGVDAIVHLANYADSNNPDFQRTFTNNVAINMNMIHTAAEMGISKFIFASSVQVINSGRRHRDAHNLPLFPYLPLDANTPPNPCNPYALAKLTGEFTLQMYCRLYNMSGIAIRFPSIESGERMQKIKEHAHKKPNWKPTISQGLAYISYHDAASLIIAILKSDLPGYRLYFPASPKNLFSITVKDAIETHYSNVHLTKPIEQIDNLVDTSQITKDTGWTPKDL